VKRLALSAVLLLSLFYLGSAVASAAAATTYLRPDQDLALGSWSVTGATSAWDALNDSVTPSETPGGSDYVTTSTTGRLEVGFETAPIAGSTGRSLSAWFYSANSGTTRLEVRTPQNDLLKKLDASGVGWHSVTIDPMPTQAELDSIFFRFERPGTSTPKVEAAFIQLTQTPSAPKLYWGAWMDGDVYTKAGEANWLDAPWSSPTWNEFQNHARKGASIIHFGQPAPWNQKFTPEPLEDAASGGGTPPRPGGAIPLMDMDADGVSLATLNSGAKDSDFKKWAEEVAAYGKPFFFRWEWEMNLPTKESAANPELFKSVWRRIHGIAEAAGAKNITWVWCPNVSFLGSASLKALYPGNAYVDWTCMDGYNFGTMPDGNGWRTFSSVFSQTYGELTSSEFEGSVKPLMIGETASTEAGGSKAEWIADGLGTYLPRNFPKIKAVLWFNWNIVDKVNGVNIQRDWQIESSPSATAAFANAISSPYYAANSFGTLPPLTRIQPLP
jgi:hypothetical protein